MGKHFTAGRLRFWLGASGWGWRLWGVSLGDAWFAGFSHRLPEAAAKPLEFDLSITIGQKDVDQLAQRIRCRMAAEPGGQDA